MGTKMFQFPTFPSYTLLYSCMDIQSFFNVSVPRVPSIKLCIGLMVRKVLLRGFPHSDIHGSKDICSSPWLFAAYHVLLRLLVPRHSPYALCSLTFWLRLNFVLLRQVSIKIFSIYTRIISKIFFLLSSHYSFILCHFLIYRFSSLLQFFSMFNIVSIALVELLY